MGLGTRKRLGVRAKQTRLDTNLTGIVTELTFIFRTAKYILISYNCLFLRSSDCVTNDS